MIASRPTCVNCGYAFPEPEPPAQCPNCGENPNTVARDLVDRVGASPKLIAHKPPGVSPSPIGIGASDSGAIQIEEGLVVHGKGNDRTEAIRLSDSEGQSTAADLLGDGTARLSIQGRSPQGEEGGEIVCRALIGRLNQYGARWGEPRFVQETGVDYEARDGEEVLKIQVTRPVRDVWEPLKHAGLATKDYPSAQQIAAELQLAIQDKVDRLKNQLQPSQLKGITLALNATMTPSSAFGSVVESFRRRHGTWARGVGFKDIWVVGPTADLTFRLDCP